MGVTLQGDEQMTKEFFVQEIDAHSEMMYRVAFMRSEGLEKYQVT